MATAKQIAWRNEFARRAAAGTLKKNPAKKRKPAAKKTVKSAYVNRPSQITRKAPTKRLKARRTERVAHPVKGTFPNPIPKMTLYATGPFDSSQFMVRTAYFLDRKEAVQYAQAIANATGKRYGVERGEFTANGTWHNR